MATHFKGPVNSTNGFQFGDSGTQLTYVQRGSVAVDPASLAATTEAETSVTIAGAVAGDTVIMNPPAAGLTAGLLFCGAYVSAADTVKIRLYNTTAGPIDEPSGNWNYCLIRS